MTEGRNEGRFDGQQHQREYSLREHQYYPEDKKQGDQAVS
jgi:hypothetical protein